MFFAFLNTGRKAKLAGSHLPTSFHSGPEPEAPPPLLQVEAAKWSFLRASWDHPPRILFLAQDGQRTLYCGHVPFCSGRVPDHP